MVEETEPYNRAGLDLILADIATYLGELRAVDGTLTYLAQCDVPSLWAEPAIQPYQEYEISVGETFPFTRRIRVYDPDLYLDSDFPGTGADPGSMHPRDIITGHMGWIWGSSRGWGSENLAAVRELAAPITHPTSSMYELSVIEPLRYAHTILQDDVSSDFGKLLHTVDNWDGPAADNFATGFYRPFGGIRASQERVFEALVGGLVTAKVIDESAQHSLMNVAHYLREIVLEQLELRQQQGNADERGREFNPLASAKTILVLAAGAGVMSVTVGSRLWAIGMEVAAGALNVAATSIPVAQPYDLAGQSAEQLLDALVDAIGEVNTRSLGQYQELELELGTVLSRVERLRSGSDDSNGRLVPIRPRLIDGVDRDDFRHRTS